MMVNMKNGIRASRMVVVLLLSLGLSSTACLQYRFANTIHPPMGKNNIYVPVFVDETTEGTLGLDIANAVRNEILKRQPRLLTAQLGQGTLVLDGTVVGMKIGRSTAANRQIGGRHVSGHCGSEVAAGPQREVPQKARAV